MHSSSCFVPASILSIAMDISQVSQAKAPSVLEAAMQDVV